MGSLMPGWDGSLGIPPKELQDIDEEMPPKIGYFEKLEKSKSLRRTSLGHPGDTTHMNAPATLRRANSERRPDMEHLQLHHHYPPGSAHHARRLDHSATVSTGATKYHATDWESEFRSLQRKSVGSVPSSSSRGASGPGSPPAWWAQLDTGALNAAQPPEEEPGSGKPHSKSVRLDFAVTGTNLH